MELSVPAHRALGSVRQAGKHATIRRSGISDHLVVGRGAGRKDRIALVALTRRGALIIGAGALAGGIAGPAGAADEIETHGISSFGDLKYPTDFKQLEYVNGNAPKGGVFSQIGPTRQYNQNFLTFNSLNAFILKGDGAQGMQMTFATLMQAAADEPDGMYGL